MTFIYGLSNVEKKNGVIEKVHEFMFRTIYPLNKDHGQCFYKNNESSENFKLSIYLNCHLFYLNFINNIKYLILEIMYICI